jgi:hypothetical protein
MAVLYNTMLDPSTAWVAKAMVTSDLDEFVETMQHKINIYRAIRCETTTMVNDIKNYLKRDSEVKKVAQVSLKDADSKDFMLNQIKNKSGINFGKCNKPAQDFVYDLYKAGFPYVACIVMLNVKTKFVLGVRRAIIEYFWDNYKELWEPGLFLKSYLLRAINMMQTLRPIRRWSYLRVTTNLLRQD